MTQSLSQSLAGKASQPTSIPPRLSIASKALAEYHAASLVRNSENKNALDRGTELLESIFGEQAKQAAFCEDFEGVMFELDEMEFLFFEGATREDDYFAISFLGLVSPRAVRTLAGVGQTVDEIIERIRFIADSLVENSPE